MDGFHQWKSNARERKALRVLTGAAYELRYVHLGHHVLSAFREAVQQGKMVGSRLCLLHPCWTSCALCLPRSGAAGQAGVLQGLPAIFVLAVMCFLPFEKLCSKARWHGPAFTCYAL